MKKRYHIIARCFDKHGQQISIGFNNYNKTHPMQKFFAEKVGQPNKIYLHAEIQALLRAQAVGTPIAHMIVERYNQHGLMEDAKPCIICLTAIKYFKVPIIGYTTKEQKFVTLMQVRP